MASPKVSVILATRWIAVLPVLVTLSQAPAAGFVPGHTYTPVDDGFIIQFDQNLDQVGKIQVAGVQTVTGATFSPDGNLVFIGRRADGVYVIEVDSSGKLVRQYDTGMGTLLRGSYIDYNPVTETYAFADDERVSILNRDLEFVTSTIPSFEFTRASGVAWGPRNSLFTTDVLEDDLIKFDSGLDFVNLGFVGEGPTGMDYAKGYLYLTIFGDGDLLRFDPATGETESILPWLGFGDISDVTVLPDGRFLTTDDNNLLSLFSPDGALLAQSDPTIFTGDGIAYYIPAPGAYLLLASTCLIGTHRRRRAD